MAKDDDFIMRSPEGWDYALYNNSFKTNKCWKIRTFSME